MEWHRGPDVINPALQQANGAFSFNIGRFYSDNGYEYMSYRLATTLQSVRTGFTSISAIVISWPPRADRGFIYPRPTQPVAQLLRAMFLPRY